MYNERPWYSDGLRFACTQCGQCCRGAPGQVWINESEVRDLAVFLGLDIDTFRRRYTFADRKGGVSLTDKGREHDYQCIFYTPEQGCTVYPHRPKQCRTWPFWGPVVRSRRAWYEHALDCPGMNRGPEHSADVIATSAQDDGLR